MKILNRHREQIEKELLIKAFKPRIAAIIAERAAFAEKVYNDTIPKAQREKMAALPSHWLPTEHGIAAKFGTTYVHLYFNGTTKEAYAYDLREKAPTEKRSFAKEYGNKVYDRKGPLSVEYFALDLKLEQLREEIKKARAGIRAQLYAFGTFDALIQHWPEIAPTVKRMTTGRVTSTALVPSAAPLNAVLDLP